MFDSITRADNIPINMSVVTEPQTLLEYIEGWRMKLWDHAYTGIFKGNDAFKKSDSFKEFRGSMLAVKRLIYRYQFIFIPLCVQMFNFLTTSTIPSSIICSQQALWLTWF
jgi:hypothetical protein